MKILKTFIVILLCICLFVTEFILGMLFTITPKIVEDTINNIDIIAIMETEDQNTTNKIYHYLDDEGIDQELINSIIETEAVKQFLNDYTMDVLLSITTNKNIEIITKEDINELAINITNDLDVDSDVKNIIIKSVDENSQRLATELNTIKESTVYEDESMEEVKTILKPFMSNDYKIITAILMIGIIVLIVVIRAKKYRFLISLSIPTIFASIAMFLAMGVTVFIKSIVIGEFSPAYHNLITTMFTSLTNRMLIIGAIFLCVAIVFIVIYNLMKKNIKE